MKLSQHQWLSLRNVLIYSNLWVAMAMAALTLVVTTLLKTHSANTTTLSFIITFCGYNYLYLAAYIITPSKIKKGRAAWIEQHKIFLTSLTLLTTLVSGYLILLESKNIQIRIIIFALLSVFYVLPTQRNIGLRWIPAFKIFLIATTWTILATLSINSFRSSNLFLIINVWIFIFGITIPFDIRDIKTDPKTLKTIPQIFGINTSIKLSQVCIFIALSTLSYFSNSIPVIIANSIFTTVCILLIQQVKNRNEADFINFYIEGLPIMWIVLLLLIKLF